MKSRIRVVSSKGKAALFFMGDEKTKSIKEAFDVIGIECFIPSKNNYGGKLSELLMLPGYKGNEHIPAPANLLSDELIMFVGVSDEDMDKALEILRSRGISVRFKAVLTNFTRNFTLPELMVHMFSEEMELKGLVGN